MSALAHPVRRAVAGFLIVAVIIGIAISFAAVWLAESIARDDLVADAEETARLVQGAVVASLAQDPQRSAEENFADTLRPQVAAGTLVRVKVWERVADDRLRLVYSDLASIVGQEKELTPGREELIGTGSTLVLPVPDDEAHRTEFSTTAELVEVFTAFSSDGRDFLLESYLETTTTVKADRLRAHLLPVLLGGMGVFTLAALPLAVILGRRISRIERERVLLIERASREHEHERTRLSQRLHDGVVQDLAGASMALSTLAAQSPPDPGRLEAVAGILRRDVVALRSVLDDLVPADLDWSGLPVALVELGGIVGSAEVTVSVAAEPAADRDATATLFRVARELLANVERHAGATIVRVSAWSDGSRAHLSVVDDGCGFDAATATRAGHVGLRIVDQVARAAGGTLEIATAPGAGTQVTLTVASGT